MQEFASIAYSFLEGFFLTSYFKKYCHSIYLATKSHEDIEYENFIMRNIGIMAIMAFMLTNKKKYINSLETGGIRVGMLENGEQKCRGLEI